MAVPRWLRLPGRAALLLGLGALSTAGARADTPQPPSGGVVPGAQDQQPDSASLLLRVEGGRVYLSEADGEFRELPLGDTPEARRLRQLIEDRGAGGDLRLNPTVLAGGGGAGFYWWSSGGKADKTEAPSKAGKAEKAGSPPKSNQTDAGKKG